jgi:hypothetical protein
MLSTVLSVLRSGGVVVVHCLGGLGRWKTMLYLKLILVYRTGTVAACVLMCLNKSISPEDAIKQVRKVTSIIYLFWNWNWILIFSQTEFLRLGRELFRLIHKFNSFINLLAAPSELSCDIRNLGYYYLIDSVFVFTHWYIFMITFNRILQYAITRSTRWSRSL